MQYRPMRALESDDSVPTEGETCHIFSFTESRGMSSCVASRGGRTAVFRIVRDEDPIPVLSAFGGLSVYKMRFARSAHHGGEDAAGRERAEHVSFNDSIVEQGGALFVLPSPAVRAPHEHPFDAADSRLWLRLAARKRDQHAAARHPC